MTKDALGDIKVLDFTWAIAGPLVTKYMADFGATVVRVELRQSPGTLRISPPYKDGIADVDRSLFFAYWNTNKYSIYLDLNNARGLEVAKRLTAWADVVVENFAAGKIEEWGLGYDDLKKINPDIIMLRSSNQGQTGPDSKHPGYGTQLSSLVGYTHLTGWPGKPPLQPWAAPTDYIAARFGVAALVTALIHRNRTGRGQCLDLSQFEANARYVAPQILDYIVNNREADKAGNTCAWAAPHGVYPCRGNDRWCTIAVFTDAEWQTLCSAINRPSLAADPRFATPQDRKKNEAELDKLLVEYTLALSPEEVMTQLQSAGIAAGVVQTSEDVYNDPQLAYRGYFWKQNHNAIGTCRGFGQACILPKTPAELKMPAPCMGEHTEFVCREFLKMSDEEFVEALTTGVFGM
jgi:benzylsuccinate CoA-transferase BbsF subunit